MSVSKDMLFINDVVGAEVSRLLSFYWDFLVEQQERSKIWRADQDSSTLHVRVARRMGRSEHILPAVGHGWLLL